MFFFNKLEEGAQTSKSPKHIESSKVQHAMKDRMPVGSCAELYWISYNIKSYLSSKISQG